VNTRLMLKERKEKNLKNQSSWEKEKIKPTYGISVGYKKSCFLIVDWGKPWHLVINNGQQF
jgi:hypothetical protein